MTHFIEIAESMLRTLEEGKVKDYPTIDFAVEGIRQALKNGLSDFYLVTRKAFSNVVPRRTAHRLYRKFLKENRLQIAELILSGQVEP